MRKKRHKLLGTARISRSKLTVATHAELDALDKEYWLRQTPQARLRATQLMWRINYGEAALGRL